MAYVTNSSKLKMYYVYPVRKDGSRAVNRMALACYNINDLRSTLIAKKILKDKYEVDVVSESGRYLGRMYYATIVSSSLWPKTRPIAFKKGAEPIYAVWVNTTKNHIRPWDFVNENGKLEGNGHYVETPDRRNMPIAHLNGGGF